jgi:hypothetical protein
MMGAVFTHHLGIPQRVLLWYHCRQVQFHSELNYECRDYIVSLHQALPIPSVTYRHRDWLCSGAFLMIGSTDYELQSIG